MKLSPIFKKITLAAALTGFVVPQANPILAVESQSQQEKKTIADVALNSDGKLVGQVVDGKGIARANATITLASSQGEIVKKVVAGKDGMFQAELPKAGVYTISGNQMSATVRVWTHQAAPPTANTGVLVVDDTNVERGQQRLAFINGRWVVVGVGAAVIGGTIVAAAEQNSAS